MAFTLRKGILLRYCSSVFGLASNTSNCALKLSSDRSYGLKYMTTKLCFSYKCDKGSENRSLETLSGSYMKPERLCWEGSSHDVLLRKLEIALMHHKLVEAWDTYKDFKRLYGFPDRSLVSRLLTELSYSSNSRWLRKGCNLVISLQKDEFGLLRPDLMTKLSLSLARAQMPVLASDVLRLMLLKKRFPPSNVLEMIFLHLVKTKTGMVLASNILIEICDIFQQLTNKSSCLKWTKPDTMIFNLVLDGCSRFGSSVKGQNIIELMAQVGVVADAQTIAIISLIYEMNGMRYELKKFKEHIDRVSTCTMMFQYRQFYESLLSLHFKFDDIDAASDLILDMYRSLVSGRVLDDRTEPVKPCLVPLGSHHLRMGLTLRVMPYLLHQEIVLNMGQNHRFVTCKDGRLVLTKKALAKVMLLYKRHGRISELSQLLCRIQKASPCSSNILHDVFDACICLGWLETAHDILDDLESEGNQIGASSYMSLWAAYHNLKMFKEADVVLKQVGKTGFLSNETEDEGTCDLKKLTFHGKSDLADLIAREMREGEKDAIPMVYKFNSSIYFFMKAQMIGDAKTAYRKMQKMKIQPTVSTYINLINGYSSMGMHREITFFWGDIKRNMENGVKLKDSDLYDLLLMNFLRGGYFERVMELIGLMKDNNMYLDKWIYKHEFLKLHRDLYRHMKVFDAKNEVQKKRIEYVKEFKKWAGID